MVQTVRPESLAMTNAATWSRPPIWRKVTTLLAGLTLAAVLVLLSTPTAYAIDGWALQAASGEDSTDRVGVSLQWDWSRRWFTDGNWYLGGYWEVGASYWDGDSGSSGTSDLYEVGVTPLLRLQRHTPWGAVTPFAEVGIGAHLLSETRLGDREFSTAFQFGDIIGAGLRFGARGQYELAYRFQHFSNAGIKEPNNGINFHVLRLVFRM